jgi:hypothetical protein
VIPDTIYIIVIYNTLTLLILFLLIRPIYENYVIKKIRTSILKNVTAALENAHASFNSKLAVEIRKVKEDMREEAAVKNIIDSTLIQKRGREDG